MYIQRYNSSCHHPCLDSLGLVYIVESVTPDFLAQSLKTELRKVVMLDWCQIWFLP